MKKAPPFQSVTIPIHPPFLPPYLNIIVFETCVFCRQEITTKAGWYTECPRAPGGVHQKRLIVADSRA